LTENRQQAMALEKKIKSIGAKQFLEDINRISAISHRVKTWDEPKNPPLLPRKMNPFNKNIRSTSDFQQINPLRNSPAFYPIAAHPNG